MYTSIKSKRVKINSMCHQYFKVSFKYYILVSSYILEWKDHEARSEKGGGCDKRDESQVNTLYYTIQRFQIFREDIKTLSLKGGACHFFEENLRCQKIVFSNLFSRLVIKIEFPNSAHNPCYSCDLKCKSTP